MYIAGENPTASFPGSARVEEALGSLDFLVVQDLFMTETARLADVVLPAASFAEKDGTFNSLEGKMRKIRKAVEPPGESRPDWQIILELAAAMERPLPFTSLEQVQKELEELISFCNYDWGEETLEEEPFWETRADLRLPLKRFPRFSPVEYTPPEPAGRGEFILLAESDLFHAGSGSRSARSGRLSRFSPAIPVKMNRSDAGKLGLGPGDRVEVISEAGRLPAVVEYSDELPGGVVSLPRSRSDHPASALFSSLPENPALSSALQRCYVRIERSKSDEPGA